MNNTLSQVEFENMTLELWALALATELLADSLWNGHLYRLYDPRQHGFGYNLLTHWINYC